MPTSLPARTRQTGGPLSWIVRWSPLLCVTSVLALCVLFAINGPQIRASADAQEARIVDEENRAFCSKFGIGPGTNRYAECAAGLADIRARALERSTSNSIF